MCIRACLWWMLCRLLHLFTLCLQKGRLDRPPTSKVNHSRLATLGVCGCLNGVLVLFASSRTPGALQSILTESLIPLTMIMSYFLLQRSYQKKELGSALVVLLGIGVALIPTIINMTKNPKNIAQSGWPLIFFLNRYMKQMTGFTSNSILITTSRALQCSLYCLLAILYTILSVSTLSTKNDLASTPVYTTSINGSDLNSSEFVILTTVSQ